MLKSILLTALLLASLAVALLWLAQRSFIYPAPKPRAIVVDGYRPVVLATADGLVLQALYRPAARGRSTLIFFHGNGDDLAGSALAVAGPGAAGHGALLPEYRGYGGNAGAPDEAGLYADGAAALAFLREHGVPPNAIVIIGYSLGSGVATELASKNDIAGLALISPFTRLPAVVESIGAGMPIGFLVSDKFDNLAKLPHNKSPVLVMHGKRDRVIPFGLGKALAVSRPATDFIGFDDAGHELAFRREAQLALTRWLADLPRQPDAAPAKSGS